MTCLCIFCNPVSWGFVSNFISKYLKYFLYVSYINMLVNYTLCNFRNFVQIQTSNLISRNCLFVYYQKGIKHISNKLPSSGFVSIPYCLIYNILGVWKLSNWFWLNSRKPSSSCLVAVDRFSNTTCLICSIVYMYVFRTYYSTSKYLTACVSLIYVKVIKKKKLTSKWTVLR